MTRTWTPESEQPKPRTGVDYHEVKAWFQQLRDIDAEIVSVQTAIKRLKDDATGCTANLSGMPGGSGYGDKVGSYAEKKDVEERRLKTLELQKKSLQAEAIHRISYISKTKSSKMMQDCLYGYYIEGQKQAKIAKSLLLTEENRVSLYVREGAKFLARIWDKFDTC